MSGTPFNRAYGNLMRSNAPATLLLIAANVITFFTSASLHAGDPSRFLVFFTSEWPRQFWTLVTWPLFGAGHPFTLLFACMWAYWVCGSLERAWGTRVFVGFFFAVSALMAGTLWIGCNALHTASGLGGLHLAVAAPTVAWCAINRREVISLYGVLPLSAALIGWLSVVIVWYEVGPPLLGLFALSGCAAAYWYAMKGRYLHRGYAAARKPSRPNLRLHVVDAPPKGRDTPIAGFPPLRWFQAWQEKRKLAKLWKRSGLHDADEPGGKGNRQDRR